MTKIKILDIIIYLLINIPIAAAVAFGCLLFTDLSNIGCWFITLLFWIVFTKSDLDRLYTDNKIYDLNKQIDELKNK